MKMSNPRKIIDVDHAFSTFLASKSISVWMPSEPTILVIGSQDISLTATFFDVVGLSVVAMFFSLLCSKVVVV